MTKNFNVPPYGQEPVEQPLVCVDCNEELTDEAANVYWELNPHGEGEPRCLDCASQLNPDDLQPPKHVLSSILFLLALGIFFTSAIFPEKAGYCVMGAVGCANVGMMTRICRK